MAKRIAGIIYSKERRIILLLVILLSLLLKVGNTTITSRNKYSARVQTEGKIGNRRSIVRPSTLIPLYQTPESLLHVTLIGMSDTRSALEGNIGIGTRRKIKNSIYGIYGFYDIRRTSQDNVVHQGTFGLEWFKEYIEIRFNVYIPQTKQFIVSEVENVSHYRKSGSTINIELGTERAVEQALRGFDIDIGFQFPHHPSLGLRGAYYRFGSSESYIENRHGLRGVLEYRLYENLQLDGELSYDNQRKLVYFGGITISYSFDKSNRGLNSLTRLEKKMTLIPIRDIDVVGSQGKYIEPVDALIVKLSELGKLKKKKILVANLLDGTIRSYELKNGKIETRETTINKKDPNIRREILKHLEIDIMKDPEVLVFIVRQEGLSYGYVDMNEMDYVSQGIEIKTSNSIKKKQTDENDFFNLVNVLHPGDPDIHRVKEIYDENTRLKKQIIEMNDRKNQLLIQMNILQNRADQMEIEFQEEKDRIIHNAQQEQMDRETHFSQAIARIAQQKMEFLLELEAASDQIDNLQQQLQLAENTYLERRTKFQFALEQKSLIVSQQEKDIMILKQDLQRLKKISHERSRSRGDQIIRLTKLIISISSCLNSIEQLETSQTSSNEFADSVRKLLQESGFDFSI